MSRKFGITIVIVGAILVLIAYFSASGIPKAAHKDFNLLVRSLGGHLDHSPDYPDVYRQISANVRMLQNFYVGAAGLILLSFGIGISVRRRNGSQEKESKS